MRRMGKGFGCRGGGGDEMETFVSFLVLVLIRGWRWSRRKGSGEGSGFATYFSSNLVEIPTYSTSTGLGL